jgi:hypothetical protein
MMRLLRGVLPFISLRPTPFVNLPLRCWVLDGQGEQLCKSLSARRNAAFTIAHRACAITAAHAPAQALTSF